MRRHRRWSAYLRRSKLIGRCENGSANGPRRGRSRKRRPPRNLGASNRSTASASEVLRMKKLSSIQTGVAGEYFVAAELSRRGYVASLTLRNTPRIDVLASNADATKSVGIQVKTCQSTRPDWLMNSKAEADTGEKLFYVFVCLPEQGEKPVFYVVPRDVVAKYVRAPSTVACHAGTWWPQTSGQPQPTIQRPGRTIQRPMGLVESRLKEADRRRGQTRRRS